ncbi:MAG: PQQ-dependent sugar dehydrogenase [Phycisphaerales bacterium]|nr:PQQ-dependent sugar dehydrogenase [Phycisphaerales bacterium]
MPVAADTILTTERVASGLSGPLFVTSPPGDTNRLFIVEQAGRIKILTGGSVLGTPFLNIVSIISSGGERGLLGLAFDPDYATNGFFYVNYTNTSGNTVVARYTVTGDPATSNTANAGSAVILKTIVQPESNHNGGCLQFGPDGMLYVGVGDGGGGNDQHGSIGNGQNTGTLLGKMLRLDVDNGPNYIPSDNPFVGAGDPLDEIWAIGLRNPWRFSFDRATGDMYIADVGQGAREEVDFQPASSTGGENYGWRCMEGTACTGMTGCTCNAPALTLPIHEYTHGGTPFRCSISGGYVYRGSAIPGLQGTYFYADYCSAQIWSFRYNGSVLSEFQERTTELTPNISTIDSVVSFGEDGSGELYIVDIGGEVFKIVASLIDCNGNGIEDSDDINAGTSLDCNANNIPDECDVEFGGSSDCNANGIPDECDTAGATSLDCNGNSTPDECETDCNFNNVPDDCDIDFGGSSDCQLDGIPDECQLGGNDCNDNDSPDECDIALGTSGDCNSNGIPDDCDPDCDNDGIPDVCDTSLVLFFDNFETDLGWTVTSEPATGGIWERAEPLQTLLGADTVQPGEDNPNGVGTFCYVTDGRGGTAGAFDVDGGPTRLMSPTIDMSGGSIVLSYAYWMYSALGTGNDDALYVEVSNNDGATWSPLATHDVSASVWRTNSVLVDSAISLTDQMRVRFVIEDTNGSSFTEALIDDVMVAGPDCPGPVSGDFDDDGDVDIDDHIAFVDCLNGPVFAPAPMNTTEEACLNAFDFDDSGTITLADFAALTQVFTGTTP